MSTASTENAASNEESGTVSPTGLNRTCEVCLCIDVHPLPSMAARDEMFTLYDSRVVDSER